MLQQIESGEKSDDFEREISKFQKMIDDKLEEFRALKQKRFKSLMSTSPTDEEDIVNEDNAVEKIVEQETAEVVSKVLDGDNEEEEEEETQLEKMKEFRPTARNLGLMRSTCLELALRDVESETDDDGELDLSGIDDDEIDSYILNGNEQKSREDLWNKVNTEYLKEKDKAVEEEGTKVVKRKQQKRKRAPCVATSANEAVETMLHEKRISSKINYKVLSAIMASDLSESIMRDIDID